MFGLQFLQQLEQRLLLRFCSCVGHPPLFVEAAFIAYAERMAVVALGVAADEGPHRERPIAARGRAVNDNQNQYVS